MIIPNTEPNHSAGEINDDNIKGPIITRTRKKIERVFIREEKPSFKTKLFSPFSKDLTIFLNIRT